MFQVMKELFSHYKFYLVFKRVFVEFL